MAVTRSSPRVGGHFPAFVLVLTLALAACSTRSGPVQPFAEDDPLPTANPAAVGLDSLVLNQISRDLARADHELHSMLVVRHGRLVFEEYYHGHGRANPHDIRSATKSITALLLGIAVDQGALPGVESPLMDHLETSYPAIRDRGDILVRHLLTMGSGVDCDDGDSSTRGQEDRMYRSGDWVEYFLRLDRPFAPGDTTRYCTAGVVALGEAIAQATGRDLADFADETLFAPLGIRNYRWARFDGNRKVDAGGHLLLTPQGMAKIGMLVLRAGEWNGRQVVPAEWVAEATEPHTTLRGTPYGYLWWSDLARAGEREVRVVWAQGNGGQTIFIVPDLDLVTVFTAGYYNSERSQAVYQIFANGVLQAVLDP